MSREEFRTLIKKLQSENKSAPFCSNAKEIPCSTFPSFHLKDHIERTEIILPIKAEDVERLKSVSSQAPYGKGQETLIDREVRDTLQVNSESLEVNQEFADRILRTWAEAKEIRATHYVHGDSESPNHSLALSDYKSQADDESDAMSIADASDAYHTLQMIEDPNHPILYNRDLYRCHCESQASNKTERYNRNNMLILSWLTHQSFDGLNLVTKQHMVPSIAIGFVKFEGRENLELNKGYPLEKDRVTVSIESPDPKVLESVGLLLKKGSSQDKGKLFSFVHVDDHKEFERFLTIKYNETISLWRKNLKVGSVLPENEVPPSRRSKRIRTSKVVDS
jgi:hypothetical protein